MADWDGGMSASCTAGPAVSASNGWPNNVLHYH